MKTTTMNETTLTTENFDESITKAINNLIGYTVIYPDVTHLYIKIFEKGLECGYIENDEPYGIYGFGEIDLFNTRIQEKFAVKPFLDVIDDLGKEGLIANLKDKYLNLLTQIR